MSRVLRREAVAEAGRLSPWCASCYVPAVRAPDAGILPAVNAKSTLIEATSCLFWRQNSRSPEAATARVWPAAGTRTGAAARTRTRYGATCDTGRLPMRSKTGGFAVGYAQLFSIAKLSIGLLNCDKLP